MASVLVASVIQDARTVLQETSENGTHWTSTELLDWLNQSYPAIVQVKPDANAKNEQVSLVTGTRQSIPVNGLRLLDVVRNTAESSMGEGITIVPRAQLDTTQRGWHREDPSVDIEHYVYSDKDPTTFYVYPPASNGAQVELVYSAVPERHTSAAITSTEETIHLNDTYAPVMLDYILFRAYSKDSDDGGSAERSMMHYRAFREALGLKVQADQANSPNAS